LEAKVVVPMSPYRPVLSLVLHSCGTLGRGHRRHQSPRGPTAPLERGR